MHHPSTQNGFDNLQICAADQSGSNFRTDTENQALNDIPLEEDPQIALLISLMGKQMQGAKTSVAQASSKPKTPTDFFDMPPPVRFIRANKKTKKEIISQ